MIELMVVVLIIVILTTMYWGGSSNSAGKKKQALCLKNLERTYIALEVYSKDYQGSFPVKPGARTSEEPLDLLVPKYTVDTSVFVCPGSKDAELPSGDSLAKHKISYAYYMGRKAGTAQEALMTDEQVDTQAKMPGQPLFSMTGKPPGNNHGKSGGNVLFCDGHVDGSGANASVSLVLTQSVILLNPKSL
jgi:prepilin-type processing-associated H-X9-DG protein